VENAILHGFKADNNKDNRVRINARCLGDINKQNVSPNRIFFTIEDNGPGIEQKKFDEILKNQQEDERYHAIKNTDRCIKLHYGDEYGVMIKSAPVAGTIVTIIIPALAAEA